MTIDRFGNFLVLELLSAGAEYQRPAIISALQQSFSECSIYDRSDVTVRSKLKEGLELAQGPVAGELPSVLLPITEHGMQLVVDIQGGHWPALSYCCTAHANCRSATDGARDCRSPVY